VYEPTRAHGAIGLWLVLLLVVSAAPAAAQPAGTVTWGVHVTLATRWLDTAETESEITPFMILYALHDALVKPMPGNLNAPSLASRGPCRRTAHVGVRAAQGRALPQRRAGHRRGREVQLRSLPGRRPPASSSERVREVQVVDPLRVRFVLKEPWPDFMTFYGTSASGAAWVVPRSTSRRSVKTGFRRRRSAPAPTSS
jgi:peptide/nickel transport system substrate-binding protein